MPPRPYTKVLIDRRPTNACIGGEGRPEYYPDIVMCIEHPSGYILKSDIIEPDAAEEAVAAIAQETLRLLREANPEMEVIWGVRQASVKLALAARFPEEAISEEPPEGFRLWDEAYLDLDRHMGAGGPALPYLWRGDVTAQEVAELFEAAAEVYKARPWKFLTDADLFWLPKQHASKQQAVFCIMGAAGVARGVAIFDSEAEYAKMADENPHFSALFVSFESVRRVPHTFGAEAEAHGWPIANRSSFPLVAKINRGEHVPFRREDLQRAILVLKAVKDMAEVHRQARREGRGR